jgi:voltage-gated potassium channel
VMLAEGLDVFRYHVPPSLAGTRLSESRIREGTGCSVVAMEQGESVLINPPPDHVLHPEAEMILIGSTEGERKFVEKYGKPVKRRG